MSAADGYMPQPDARQCALAYCTYSDLCRKGGHKSSYSDFRAGFLAALDLRELREFE